MKSAKLIGPLKLPAKSDEGRPRVVTLATFYGTDNREVANVNGLELSDDFTLTVPESAKGEIPDGATFCNLFFDSHSTRGGSSLYRVGIQGAHHASGDQAAGKRDVGEQGPARGKRAPQ